MSYLSSKFEEVDKRFEIQDVFFPNPLVKNVSNRRELFLDYGHTSGIYLRNQRDNLSVSQKESYHEQYFSAENPTLPVSSSALKVDYPFKDRVMGENLSNIKKSRYFTTYICKMRGAWLSKVPFNYLKPLQRVIDGMTSPGYDIKDILRNQATPILRDYILDYPSLFKANIENYNSDYVGGCLTVLKNEREKRTVCFPSGLLFDKLSIRDLIAEENDKSFYKYNGGIEIDIGNSIYEVQSTVIRDTGYCGIRCNNNRCYLMRFQGENYCNTLNTVETGFEKPTSICLSPHIEGESLIATNTGTVYIWNVGRGLNTIILNKATRFSSNDKWRQVHYGACPQELILTDKTVVEMFDRRIKCESSIDLFALPNKILLNSERITTSCKHPKQPYQHLVSTDNSLILVDQRFPQHCVMYWNHILETCPGLMSVYYEDRNNVDNSIVLLASQYPPETCCFQFQQSSTDPVHSTQTPWRLSKISDICDFYSPLLNTHSILSKKRLDTSLCGIASVFGDTPNSVVNLQLDCHGELFYQVYSTFYSKDELTCSAGPGFNKNCFSQAAQGRTKTWMSSLERHVALLCEKSDVLNVKFKDHSETLYEIRETVPAHNLCALCSPKTVIHEDELCDEKDEVCCSCYLSVTTARSLYKANKQDKLADVSCNGFEMFNAQIPSYNKLPHSSVRSNILIKLWKEENPDLTEYIVEADKDTKIKKKEYKKAVNKLKTKALKRKKYFSILRKHDYDLNRIYFRYKDKPSAFDRVVEGIVKWHGEDDLGVDTESVITSSSKISSSTAISKTNLNTNLLAHQSQNLSMLQTLQSCTDSNSHIDSYSSSDQFSPIHPGNKVSSSPERTPSKSSIQSLSSPNTPRSRLQGRLPSPVSSCLFSDDGFKTPDIPVTKRRKKMKTFVEADESQFENVSRDKLREKEVESGVSSSQESVPSKTPKRVPSQTSQHLSNLHHPGSEAQNVSYTSDDLSTDSDRFSAKKHTMIVHKQDQDNDNFLSPQRTPNKKSKLSCISVHERQSSDSASKYSPNTKPKSRKSCDSMDMLFSKVTPLKYSKLSQRHDQSQSSMSHDQVSDDDQSSVIRSIKTKKKNYTILETKSDNMKKMRHKEKKNRSDDSGRRTVGLNYKSDSSLCFIHSADLSDHTSVDEFKKTEPCAHKQKLKKKGKCKDSNHGQLTDRSEIPDDGHTTDRVSVTAAASTDNKKMKHKKKKTSKSYKDRILYSQTDATNTNKLTDCANDNDDLHKDKQKPVRSTKSNNKKLKNSNVSRCKVSQPAVENYYLRRRNSFQRTETDSSHLSQRDTTQPDFENNNIRDNLQQYGSIVDKNDFEGSQMDKYIARQVTSLNSDINTNLELCGYYSDREVEDDKKSIIQPEESYIQKNSIQPDSIKSEINVIDSFKEEINPDSKPVSDCEENLKLDTGSDHLFSSQHSDTNSVFGERSSCLNLKLETDTDSCFRDITPSGPNGIAPYDSVNATIPDISRHSVSSPVLDKIALQTRDIKNCVNISQTLVSQDIATGICNVEKEQLQNTKRTDDTVKSTRNPQRDNVKTYSVSGRSSSRNVGKDQPADFVCVANRYSPLSSLSYFSVSQHQKRKNKSASQSIPPSRSASQCVPSLNSVLTPNNVIDENLDGFFTPDKRKSVDSEDLGNSVKTFDLETFSPEYTSTQIEHPSLTNHPIISTRKLSMSKKKKFTIGF